MLSLKDKLLKAGLVTEEQVKKAEQEKAAARSSPAARAQRDNSESTSPIPKLPPLPGSKAHQRDEAKRQLELDRQLRELVTSAQVPVEPGSRTFYFVTRKARLRRLELSEQQARLLEEGVLAVVERPDPDQIAHALVPAAAAEQLMALSEKAVRFFSREGAKVGFVSDDEIQSRRGEADGPDDGPG